MSHNFLPLEHRHKLVLDLFVQDEKQKITTWELYRKPPIQLSIPIIDRKERMEWANETLALIISALEFFIFS